MAQLIEALAITGSRKSDGSANASGRLWAYVPGTTTPITLYADYDATEPLTQPVTLNAAGKATAYLTGRADLVIETSTGAALDSFTYGNRDALVEVVNDGFTGTLPSGSQGAGGITDLSTVLTSIATSMGLDNGSLDGNYRGRYGTISLPVWKEIESIWFNVKRFGALGNGVQDDTTYIQAAINAASGAGGGVVFLPIGTYPITAALALPTKVILMGAGRGATVIRNSAGTTGCITASGSYINVSSMSLTHATSSTGRAFQATGATDKLIAVSDVIISGHRTGVYSVSDSFSLDDFEITTTTSDSSARGIDVAHNEGAFLRLGRIAADTGYAIQFNTTAPGENLLMIHGVRISSAARGLSLDGTDKGNVTVDGSALLGSSADVYIGSTAGGLYIGPGNYLSGTGVVNNNNTTHPIFVGADTSEGVQIRPYGGEGYRVDVAAAGSHTPRPWQARHVMIRATSAGVITVNPTGNDLRDGHDLIITFYNNSGGAVTWTLDAQYHVVAAPAPANGSKSTIYFVFDSTLNTWNQVGAVATVTA